MPQYFDETFARSLLDKGDIDGCIEYSMPCVWAQMKRPCNSFANWDDLESESFVYLVMAIQRYDPSKGAKLFSWITNYLNYARLNWLKKELPILERTTQFEDGIEEFLADLPYLHLGNESQAWIVKARIKAYALTGGETALPESTHKQMLKINKVV
jgi:hypothetical protein